VPDIVFGDDDRAVFPTKFQGNMTLSKTKWTIICEAPERHYYRYNGDKVATTLINPDVVRHHLHNKCQLFYYKKFTQLMMSDQLVFGHRSYPVEQPKMGKMFVPPKSK
jgi:hypothetical protein